MPSPARCIHPTFTRLSCLLTVALVALPAHAGLTSRTAQCEAQAAQARLHRQQQRKARQAKGLCPAEPRTAAAPVPARPGFGLRKLLQPGLLFLLAATSGQPLPSFAQVPDGQNPWPSLPSFDFGGNHSIVGQSLQLALARANGTGALPPLAELNAYLAERSPERVSALAALPEAAPFDLAAPGTTALPQPRTPLSLATPPPLPDTSAEGLSPAASKALTDEMLAVMTTLTAARLIEAQATLLSIGYQILTIATLQTTHVQAGVALRVVAFELQSMAFAFGALASHEQALSAERILGDLEAKAVAEAQAQLAASTGSAFSAQAAQVELGGFLDPSFIYGTWQRLENTLPGDLVLYKISRNELVKVQAGTDNRGRRAVHTENHPGTVTSDVSYLLPGEAAPEEATSGATVVKVRVDQASGQRMELDFRFLQAQGSAGAGPNQVRLDVLIEQDGDRKAFVKIANI